MYDLVKGVNENEHRLNGLGPPEISPDLVSPFMALTALRGFWPMSSRDENGDVYDLSGQGRTLAEHLEPESNYDNLAPYVGLAFEQTLSRADEAGLDILGTEAHVDSGIRGLTLGGWYYVPSGIPSANLMGKWRTVGVDQRSYFIFEDNFAISSDGTAGGVVQVGLSIPLSTWCFVVGRFTPSTEMAAWVNMVKVTNTVDIPASIFNSTADFQIGTGPSDTDEMRVSCAFLCAAALSDAHVSSLFNQTRAAFRV